MKNQTLIIFNMGTSVLYAFHRHGTLYIPHVTSGRPSHINDPKSTHIKDMGPIPLGMYFCKKNDLSDPVFVLDLARRLKGDWGDWRIRLYPHLKTLEAMKAKNINRDRFFIHGGSQEGSAGCIDIGGGILGNKYTNELKEIILNSSVSEIDVEIIH